MRVALKIVTVLRQHTFFHSFIYSQFCQGGVRVALKTVTVLRPYFLRQHTFSSQFYIFTVLSGWGESSSENSNSSTATYFFFTVSYIHSFIWVG